MYSFCSNRFKFAFLVQKISRGMLAAREVAAPITAQCCGHVTQWGLQERAANQNATTGSGIVFELQVSVGEDDARTLHFRNFGRKFIDRESLGAAIKQQTRILGRIHLRKNLKRFLITEQELTARKCVIFCLNTFAMLKKYRFRRAEGNMNN